MANRVLTKRKVCGGTLAFIGYMLSPLSWWNDLFVNWPLALAFAWGDRLVLQTRLHRQPDRGLLVDQPPGLCPHAEGRGENHQQGGPALFPEKLAAGPGDLCTLHRFDRGAGKNGGDRADSGYRASHPEIRSPLVTPAPPTPTPPPRLQALWICLLLAARHPGRLLARHRLRFCQLRRPGLYHGQSHRAGRRDRARTALRPGAPRSPATGIRSPFSATCSIASSSSSTPGGII